MVNAVRKWSFLPLVLLLVFKSGFTQEMTPGVIEVRKEVADSVGAFYFYDSTLNMINPQYYPVDTSLHHFHHYQPLQSNGRAYARIGNTGLAYTRLKPNGHLHPESQYGINSYDAYRFVPGNLPYYKLNVPFTLLAYTSGEDREQVFKGRHYQQVRRNLGVGIGFNIHNSIGSYIRQKSDNVSMAFQVLYRSQNQRYGIAANFINNRFKHRENGGILNPERFEGNMESDRGRMSVKLNTAENRWRETNTYFRQYIHLFDPKHQENDSISGTHSGLGTLVHKFNYQRLAQVYEDKNPLSGFYREILIDSTLTTDSMVLHTVYNELLWNFPLIENDFMGFTINAGIGHVFMHYRMLEINQKYNQITPLIMPELRLGERLTFIGNFRRITGDFRNGDQELGAVVSYRFKNLKPVIIEGSLNHALTSPGLFYHIYQSNHFEWNNQFDKQESNELGFSIQQNNTKVGASYTTINGFAYLDTLARPAWYAEKFNIVSAFINSRLEWRKLIVDNKFTFQHISDETALRLPAILLNSTLGYEIDLFDGALQAMGGVELFYNSAWKAQAYMPATRSFYLQNQTETGNYPFIDVFLNLRVKRARIFFLMQHVNEGLLGYDYYMIPHYPMPDRAFKFGINWMFYD